jgi:hypothetical protein
MSLRSILSFGLFFLICGVCVPPTAAQSVELPRIEINPISAGGTLVTIQTPVHLNLHTLDTHIEDVQLRSAIPNLPQNATVVEIKSTGPSGSAQILLRDSVSTWRPAPIGPPTSPSSVESPPILWLTTTDAGPYRLITQLVPPESIENSWGWPKEGPFAISTRQNLGVLKGLLSNTPQLVIVNNRGRLFPSEWFNLIKNSGRPYVIVTPQSPNRGFEGIKSAAGLGDRPIQPNSVHILSAFPKLDGWISGYWELHRINLELSQRGAWEKILSSIKSQRLPAPISDASKSSLREELVYGNSDFVFLIAHNDGHFVYLPGSEGPISYDEIRSLQRSDAPNRTIVLVTCNGGTLNENPRALADILLQNKLAKSVFASQGDIYADTVPSLLRDLLVGGSDVRSTLIKYGYFQFVIRLVRPNPNA